MAIATRGRIVVHKDSVSAKQMLSAKDFKVSLVRGIGDFFDRGMAGPVSGRGALAAVGHCRLVTNGLQGIDANNQPICRGNCIVVHNGIVVNVDALWARETAIKPTANVDTEVIGALIEKYRVELAVTDAVRRTFKDIYGETSVGLLFRDLNSMLLATNTGSLFAVPSRDGTAMFFASEAYICKKLTTGDQALPDFEGLAYEQIKAGEGSLIDLEDLSRNTFSLEVDSDGERIAIPNVSRGLGVQRTIEDKAKRFEAYRNGIKRCKRCLLPETMPRLSFDENGVCNYCHSHRGKTLKSIAELENIFDKHRSRDGSPDCLIAFSGGRDSSMGLHLLKSKYRMTPIAYTYDWGMVTDLARRNQARMCGRLGVEHVWVSANIKQKRDNIRRNVQAWLKKPDLGLVPLFMAGDKQFFWHANRMMKDTGIPLMVLCANHCEKTDFKAGFLGVSSRSATIHKPASLSASAKAGMLVRYGMRFLSNPRYLNPSLPDTVGAFVSYYVINQDYVSLFDHLAWDEEEINRTLIGEYDWEIAKDTRTTWRIGDGTAPFYNYIYYSIAGFTESDTFRSNQIREGVMTRDKAAVLVEEENQPRWDSIREYLQLINVDFDEAIRIIDRIPKLYVPAAEGGAGLAH